MNNLFVVTGANGFLGSAVVKELLSRGKKVIGLIYEHNTWSDNFSPTPVKKHIIQCRYL